jgi:hypothetical protein
MQPRSLVEAFAQGNSEVASLLRTNNLVAEANLFGQYAVVSSLEYTNDSLSRLLYVACETNKCLLILSDDIRDLRRSSEATEGMFRELLARDSVQADMEEFIYQLEKLVACFVEDEAAAVPLYLAFTGQLGVIADDKISTVIIRGRGNKTAFERAYEAATKIQEKLAGHPKVKLMFKKQAEERWRKREEERLKEEELRRREAENREEQRRRWEEEGRRLEEERRQKSEERRRKEEEDGRRLEEEGRQKSEERRRKKEEDGRRREEEGRHWEEAQRRWGGEQPKREEERGRQEEEERRWDYGGRRRLESAETSLWSFEQDLARLIAEKRFFRQIEG